MLDKDSSNPQVVSIGPIHHGKPDLHAMEPYKWRCLKRYLHRSQLNAIPYVLLNGFFVKGRNPPLEDNSSTISLPEHIHKFFKDVGIPSTNYESTEDIKNLEEAGVKFENKVTVDSSKEKPGLALTLMKEDKRVCLNCNETINCLCDIQFTTRGVLTMPPLKVNEFFETFFRNLIAFEQCMRYDDEGVHITSYIILMGNLIKTPKDVELLVGRGIIEDLVDDYEVVSRPFSSLCKEIAMDKKDFDFAPLCLNKYR
ncbi:hypothetical protein LguiA_033136 [Lonicera macranthoides]